MWYEIFKFELKYRAGRPETYMFFAFLLLFSVVGVDFIFQGVEIGLMKKNAPLVIGKTMGAISGLCMIMVSMIMGVPVLRDYQYQINGLLFVNPLSKRDYLLGRFLGSFVVVLLIYCGLPLGMMLGAQMPWHDASEMLTFNAYTYFQTFCAVVLPSLFFGASVFFVTGMLSKKLLVVYTQGVVLFVLFLLTKAITNAYVQGLLDPFSLTTLTQYAKDWTVLERNTTPITLSGILLHNSLFWMGLGLGILIFGYYRFSFSIASKKTKRLVKKRSTISDKGYTAQSSLPIVDITFSLKAKCQQLISLTGFYTHLLLKQTSFWAIVICGIVVIIINAVNLGTVYGVDSYPATYFMIAELQEMSMFFFIIILLFYSGELIWKERNINQYLLNDATPTNSLVIVTSKFLALIVIYMVLMLTLIITGIAFQISHGYYQFELGVYFTGFFIEILPFLVLYTFVAFFLQTLSNNKFIGILLMVFFFIATIGLEYLGYAHSLFSFGGKPLGIYSEMNGYGHFLSPYLWIKAYWGVFGILLLLLSALLLSKGTGSSLYSHIRTIKTRMSASTVKVAVVLVTLWILLGGYIYYNTNIINTYWSSEQQQAYRAGYETTLKSLEYIPQPKITDVKLFVELYPETRSYEIKGSYVLKNTTTNSISTIHLQKQIASHLKLSNVVFEGGATAVDTYQRYEYTIYKLSQPLQPGTAIQMDFTQTYNPRGFEDNSSSRQFVYNGTFFNNSILPSLGYNNNYELQDKDQRQAYDLPPRASKAAIDDTHELFNARSGGDADRIHLDMTLGTSAVQTAISSGSLIDQFKKDNRNYFRYVTQQPIINFYAAVSAVYAVKKDSWQPKDREAAPVALEIYYHDEHAYNIDRMMAGMKASLSYFSEQFTPYQYDHLRIMEFPRYEQYAQSFPGVIPFSESMGFVLDIDDTTDVDMAFYITAHEVAHQWFGMQIEAANVQGRNFILETLAQYGAMMVLKETYTQEKLQQFLTLQEEIYQENRKKAVNEPSLALVENQDFVYYHKGALAMYELQQLIGEEQVNKAIQAFIQDWHSQTGHRKQQTKRYPTSNDLLSYFKAVTPSDLQYKIKALFEEVE